ncbi:hypothetical protein [Pseudomonas sp. BW7P1]|uniref:hypothetical protein n=1 Tax=Pseudomonas TaxID=286 RepID=UPI0021AD80C6|nr:hypothetical protein [Pseudomonas sp. BW7P1]UWI62227.1 hypothetical protein NWV16_02155 [Pseudomonas sp. BW7P1]
MVNGRKTHVSSSPARLATDSVPGLKRPGEMTMFQAPEIKVARRVPSWDQAMPSGSDVSVTVTGLPTMENVSIRSVGMSLERFRLKLPPHMPVADGQGIRRFKGREFVDVAPGEIVQVRQDATTGEYRAMLPAEAMASGPTLALDPRTMLWYAGELSIPGGIDNVISARPPLDLTGHKPAMDTRATTAPGKLYEGRDDLFERQASGRVRIVARGMSQFEPRHSAILRAELNATHRIFTDAGKGLAAGYVEAESIFKGYFGKQHELIKSRISDCLSRGEALSTEYQGPWGQDKFVGVAFDRDRKAWMYPLDFHGRFFISLNHVEEGDFAVVLGHEMLHTNRINRFKGVGPGAVDYFYLDAQMANALDRPVPAYDIAERGISEIIMQGGMTLAYLDGFTSDHSNFRAGVKEGLGFSGELDVRAAIELFNLIPFVRTWMASKNADSIIYAARSLQALHLARTADSQLLSGLLSH